MLYEVGVDALDLVKHANETQTVHVSAAVCAT